MIRKRNLLNAGFKKYDEGSYRLIVNQDKPNEFIIEVRIDTDDDKSELLDIGIAYYLHSPLNVEFQLSNYSSLTIKWMFKHIQIALIGLTNSLNIDKLLKFTCPKKGDKK